MVDGWMDGCGDDEMDGPMSRNETGQREEQEGKECHECCEVDSWGFSGKG